MKKAFIITLSLIFLSLMLYIVFNNKPIQTAKALSVFKDYSYTYDTEQALKIDLYLNKVDQPLMYKESYDSVYIKSNDDLTLINVTLQSITKTIEDEYLGEIYFLYEFKVYLPKLDNDLSIDNALLVIDLINGKHYEFSIGRVSLFYKKYHLIEGNWTNIRAIKDDKNNLSRAKYVEIILEDNNIIDLDYVKINAFTELIYNINDNVLMIEIPFEQYLLNQFSLIVSINQNETFIIGNHVFIIDYKILTYASSLINVYETSSY